MSGAYDFSDFSPDPGLAMFIATVTNYVGVPQTDITPLRAASPAWVVDKTVAPLYFIDSQDDLMPADQVDDLAAQLNADGVRNYTALTVKGSGHSFANWDLINNGALAFLATQIGGR